jgi:CRISPR-associated endonuclease/helicase Cas3
LLVVDEVHASDFYMSRLLEFLLKHHLGVGGRAMLLSATLGARARYRYTGRTRLNGEGLCSVSDAEKEPYPAITLADGKLLTVQSSPEAVRHVHFEAIPFALQLEAVAKVVITALGAKARVLVIMNTVDRANALLRSVEANNTDPGWLFACRGVICPHHGRFAPEDRLLLDAQVSERFGPESIPGPVLLVGTQTLEQSLDIDADLLITDLAPADVLLQRVGRLHRHARPLRPAGYETPHCFVLVPNGDLEGALDQRGEVKGAFKRLGYGSVYEDLRALELTRQALLACPQVGVPTDNRRLVEAVTHPEKLASLAGAAWKLHGQLIEGGELAQAIAAGNAAAIFDKHFGDFDFNELGGKVAVRLGADSLQLPLDHPLISPFEQRLESIVIPGHMAPRSRDEVVKIEEELEDRTILTCGDHRYCYSRYGLERQK